VPAGTFNVGGDGSLLYWNRKAAIEHGPLHDHVYPRVLR